jgi:hypothetical protein
MLSKLKPKAQVTPLFSATAAGDSRRADAWLSDRLKRGKSEFFSEVVAMTPALAEIILNRCNTGNRPVSPANVKKHVDIITGGRWLLSSQGISFSSDGILNNGQHRLRAIAECGRAVDVMATFGEERRAFLIHDTQKPRGGSDALAVEGYKNTVALSAAAKLVYDISAGSARARSTIGNEMISEVVANNPDLPGVVSWASFIGQSLKSSTSGICVAAYLITRKYGDDMVRNWFDQVRTGLGLVRDDDPIYRLRAVLPMFKGRKDAGITVAAVTVKAWNASARGRRIKGGLSWRDTERFPEVQ